MTSKGKTIFEGRFINGSPQGFNFLIFFFDHMNNKLKVDSIFCETCKHFLKAVNVKKLILIINNYFIKLLFINLINNKIIILIIK